MKHFWPKKQAGKTFGVDFLFCLARIRVGSLVSNVSLIMTAALISHPCGSITFRVRMLEVYPFVSHRFRVWAVVSTANDNQRKEKNLVH